MRSIRASDGRPHELHKYNMVEFLDMSFAQRCNMCIYSTDKTYDDRKADFYEAFGLGMFHVTHPEVQIFVRLSVKLFATIYVDVQYCVF